MLCFDLLDFNNNNDDDDDAEGRLNAVRNALLQSLLLDDTTLAASSPITPSPSVFHSTMSVFVAIADGVCVSLRSLAVGGPDWPHCWRYAQTTLLWVNDNVGLVFQLRIQLRYKKNTFLLRKKPCGRL